MINKCKNCGGNLTFSPKNKGNKCESCGSIFPIDYSYDFPKNPFTQASNLEIDPKEDEWMRQMKNLKCESCGANIVLAKNQIQTNCPYCGNSVMIKERAKKLMHIDSIIPFSFDKADALKIFNRTVTRRFYADKKIFNRLNKNNIHGLYINAFVFDFLTTTTYDGTFTYTIKETDAEGNHSERVAYKNVTGIYEKKLENITIEANPNIEQVDLNGIMPFEYASAVEFKDEFMNGYMLEYQDKLFNKCVEQAENIVTSIIKHDLLTKHHCDDIVNIKLDTLYLDKRYNYCLLPMYSISKVHKDKKYTAFMNGQTGRVGKLPSSKLRVFLTILFGAILIVGLILLVILFGE